MKIQTDRLIIRPWRDEDRAAMAAMLSDPEVMWDYRRLFDRAESDTRIDRYHDSYLKNGFGRWPVLRAEDGMFLGCCGIMPIPDEHPMFPGVEIGWRFTHAAWGHGYASEAARACMRDGFERCGMTEIWSYTAPDNLRSEAVMKRIGLVRSNDRRYPGVDGAPWLVYVGRVQDESVSS